MILGTKKACEDALEGDKCNRKDDCHHIDEKFATRSCAALAALRGRRIARDRREDLMLRGSATERKRVQQAAGNNEREDSSAHIEVSSRALTLLRTRAIVLCSLSGRFQHTRRSQNDAFARVFSVP